MGQQEVQKILEMQEDWISTKQILIILKTKNFGDSYTKKLSRCLNAMEKFNEVERKRTKGRDYFWRLTERYKNT